jgi:hypothetical protein
MLPSGQLCCMDQQAAWLRFEIFKSTVHLHHFVKQKKWLLDDLFVARLEFRR